LQIAA